MRCFRRKLEFVSKHFVNGCLCKQYFASNSPQIPSNLICLTIFVIVRHLAQFQPKIRVTNLQKSAKICLTLITTFTIFSLSSKFSIESLSRLVYDGFLERKFPPKYDYFYQLKLLIKT